MRLHFGDVRFGSQADIAGPNLYVRYVRYGPETDSNALTLTRPLNYCDAAVQSA
jgi:hypothetical protein